MGSLKIIEKDLFHSSSILLKDISQIRCVVFAVTESAEKDRLELRLHDGSIPRIGRWLGKVALLEAARSLVGPTRKIDIGAWIERG